jgi:FG-GAP-like repeat
MRLLLILVLLPVPSLTFAADFPKFKTQEIDAGLKIGYAVLTSDINGDKKPDIVVVDKHQVVWYENPSWKKRIILDGKSKPDNVCATAVDITGDGLPELVLGSAWKPADTVNPAQLSWLKRGKSLEDEWTLHELPCDEPTVHRVRAFDIDGDGKDEIVHVPLHGKGATPKGNYMDGRPVRVIALKIPAKDPEKKENWKTEVLSEELHVCHNFYETYPQTIFPTRPTADILIASYEGVYIIASKKTAKIGEGNQANPKGSRGASEIKEGNVGRLFPKPVIATIEPWHGNQVVTYTPSKEKLWDRHVIDDHLRWGHAVCFANLDGETGDELVIGVRDDPSPKAGDKHTERRGVRIYKCIDDKGAKWERMLLDEGGVAVEDLCAQDLNGDGKIDIIAVGRQTMNCRIYWNQGK